RRSLPAMLIPSAPCFYLTSVAGHPARRPSTVGLSPNLTLSASSLPVERFPTLLASAAPGLARTTLPLAASAAPLPAAVARCEPLATSGASLASSARRGNRRDAPRRRSVECLSPAVRISPHATRRRRAAPRPCNGLQATRSPRAISLAEKNARHWGGHG